MSAEQLIDALKEYGADVTGAMERFMDDTDLYQTCMQMFVEDHSFEALGQALKAGDCRKAFDAAHALKGVSGNLGLTPMYTQVCEIVEPLRKQNSEGLMPKYEALLLQLDEIKKLL